MEKDASAHQNHDRKRREDGAKANGVFETPEGRRSLSLSA